MTANMMYWDEVKVFSVNADNEEAALFCYLHNDEKIRKAIVLCPGGAYIRLGMDDEEMPSAKSYYDAGYQVFALAYSVGRKAIWPATVTEALKSIGMIRRHAAEWHVNPNAIAIEGFSAGGGVALCAGTYWNDPEYLEKIGYTAEEVRPNAVLLLYTTYRPLPIITEQGWELYSPDCLERVCKDTPPMFIGHSYEDQRGSMEYCMELAKLLSRLYIPSELHIFTWGKHGQLGLPRKTMPDGITNGGYEDWVDRSIIWLGNFFDKNALGREMSHTIYTGEPMENWIKFPETK